MSETAKTLKEQFNGDWEALEKTLPSLIAKAVGTLLRKHQIEGVRFAIDLLQAEKDARGARILERYLTSITQGVDSGTKEET